MSLTHREIEVLGHVAAGETQASIAELLGISYDAVNYHVDNVKLKLEARNTPNAVAIALRQKIIA